MRLGFDAVVPPGLKPGPFRIQVYAEKLSHLDYSEDVAGTSLDSRAREHLLTYSAAFCLARTEFHRDARLEEKNSYLQTLASAVGVRLKRHQAGVRHKPYRHPCLASQLALQGRAVHHRLQEELRFGGYVVSLTLSR